VDLRRHILDRAAVGPATAARERFGQAKVGDLEQRALARVAEQNVFWLEVPVHNVLRMAILDTGEQMCHPTARDVLGDTMLRAYHVCQRAQRRCVCWSSGRRARCGDEEQHCPQREGGREASRQKEAR
jgi:hypothetical protein